MKQLKKVLKTIDIYGNIIGFKYEGEDRIKSVLGGCLTIILVIISAIISIIKFIDWSNNYNLSLDTNIFFKDLTNPDSFNSTLFGIKLGFLKLHKDGIPTSLGDLNLVGESFINHVSFSGVPFLHEKKRKIGNIINCYESENSQNHAAFIKFQDSSLKDSYKNLLCSNISKDSNISIGSDFISSVQSEYLESDLIFDTCKVTPKCKDFDAINSEVFNEFRLYLSITNQFFDKNNYDGFKSTYSSHIYHRLNFNKDLQIDLVVTKHVVITDPNKLFTFSPIYHNEFYSYRPTIMETNRKIGLSNENGSTKMNVNIVVRDDDQEVIIFFVSLRQLKL